MESRTPALQPDPITMQLSIFPVLQRSTKRAMVVTRQHGHLRN
jgi:hypothetical protein